MFSWNYIPQQGEIKESSNLDSKESACNVDTQVQSLQKGKATYSRILAWRIPWTKEPGGLQSAGSQRVRGQND